MRNWMAPASVVGCIFVFGAAGWGAETKVPLRAYLVHHGEPAFQKLAEEFEKDTGTHVDVTFECRREMLKLITTRGDGDVCTVSGPENFEAIEKAGLAVGAAVTIGEVIPVIEVHEGQSEEDPVAG